MNNKKILLPVVFAVMMVSFSFMVSAVAGVGGVTPSANFSNLSGSAQLINSSILLIDGTSMVGNVSFYYQHWSYAHNATWTLISNVRNISANQTFYNTTWDTTAIVDDKYILNFTSYNANLTTVNATNVTRNVTVDNTAPTLAAYSGATLTAYANGTSIKTNATLTGSVFPNNLTLNISVTDATVGLLNTTELNCFINIGGGLNHTVPLLAGRWCNSTDINITGLTDGNKTLNVYINDTLNNMRLNNTLVVQVDATAPAPTATCSSTTVSTGETFPCSCSTSDATSGINSVSSGGTSTSPDGTATPSSTGVFTYTCSAVDNGGLTASATKSYTVTQTPGGGGVGSGGGGTTASEPQIYSFSKITPGAASIAKYSDPELGLKQIEINVNSEAQSVKITVTKYDGKPAEVSVSKTGKVYQYIQIETQNLATKLDKAKVQFKVEKSWASSNGLDKDEVAVSKFDETGEKWNELPTTFASEDSDFYYYDTEVTGFSYFAISEKGVVAEEAETGTPGGAGAAEGGGMSTWWWVVVAVVVLLVIWMVIRKK